MSSSINVLDDIFKNKLVWEENNMSNPFNSYSLVSALDNIALLDLAGTILKKYQTTGKPIPEPQFSILISSISEARLYSTKRDWEVIKTNVDPFTLDLLAAMADWERTNN